ncbi:hypothetical protein JCGZ_03533 [Jatropha curcas]|uniref:Aminotransferase-like plant mobile domain-containing protein n=1 Tax=Jatropha curcas TaxID=180498 RepID=A0A067LD74_JATCU|nr:hypothetical protein JCGZ_03533 [Jatropha curcas]
MERATRGCQACSSCLYQRGERPGGALLCTSQNKGDPVVLACLWDLSLIRTYDWASPALAHLYHGLDVWTRGSGESNWQFLHPLEVWAYEYRISPGGPEGDTSAEARRIPRYLAHRHHTYLSSEDPHYWRRYLNDRALADDRRRHQTLAFYRAQAKADVPAEPVGAVLGDVPFPPSMEVALDPTLSLGPAIAIPADLRQAPPQLQLDPEHATHVPAQRYQELYQRFCFAWSYIARLYLERHDMMEVDRLRTRLEVEGIPLDFSEEEDDDEDGSSSDDAPTPPPSSVRQAAAGPSRSPRYDLAEVATLCPVYLPDGIDPDQGIPLEPFLTRVLSMDANPSWVRAYCFLLLNMYVMKNRQPGVGDFRLLTVVRDMQWTCPWWRIRLVTARSMNLSYVLYASLDRSMAYFPDRINPQYGVVQRIPRVHNFASGPMTQSLLSNLADRWLNRNTWYMGQGAMQDTVTTRVY